jgi:hypothetical protein
MLTKLRTSIALISSLGLVVGFFVAPAAFANPNYPTAAEVSAAKRNVADQQKMITRIEELIATQEAEAEVLNQEVNLKTEIYAKAQEQVDVITRQVELFSLIRRSRTLPRLTNNWGRLLRKCFVAEAELPLTCFSIQLRPMTSCFS